MPGSPSGSTARPRPLASSGWWMLCRGPPRRTRSTGASVRAPSSSVGCTSVRCATRSGTPSPASKPSGPGPFISSLPTTRSARCSGHARPTVCSGDTPVQARRKAPHRSPSQPRCRHLSRSTDLCRTWTPSSPSTRQHSPTWRSKNARNSGSRRTASRSRRCTRNARPWPRCMRRSTWRWRCSPRTRGCSTRRRSPSTRSTTCSSACRESTSGSCSGCCAGESTTGCGSTPTSGKQRPA